MLSITPERIFSIKDPETFNQMALETYAFQIEAVPVYRDFVRHLGHAAPQTWEEIPCLPISVFKRRRVLADGYDPTLFFASSGTTGQVRSCHWVADPRWYEESLIRGFERVYGSPKNFCFLALLPNYLEQEHSSLVYMVRHLMAASGHPDNGFFLDDYTALSDRLDHLERLGQSVILFGVSYALLDFGQFIRSASRQVRIFETGGMKGRREELSKADLHHCLRILYGVTTIESEYGMTEVFSQAYSEGGGVFRTPPWMRVGVRSTADPLSYAPSGVRGGINVIDLANQLSCAFIATEDLGQQAADGSFEILGRLSASDLRGCNLMVD